MTTTRLSAAASAALGACGILLFRWPPATALALTIEPIVSLLLGATAVLLAVGVCVNWLRRAPDHERATLPSERRSPWLDLVVCSATLLLFLLPVVAVWSSRYPSQETAASALMSRLPWSDAMGYWEGALGVLEHGSFDAWNHRRPLNAILYSVRLGLSGLNFELSLLMQALALGFAVFLAAKAIRASYGAISAIAFVAALYPYTRNYLALTLSEALGITLGCLALAGFTAGSAERDDRLTLGAMFLLGLALFARTGTMLVLPALVVWFSLAGPRSWKRTFVRFSWSASAAILLPVLLNKSLTLLYGQGGGMMNDNFAHTILGLTMGTNWISAQTHYKNDLQTLPWDQQSLFMYRMAWEHFQDNPWVLLGSLQRGLVHFLQGFPGAYRRLSVPPSLVPLFESFGVIGGAAITVLTVVQLVRRTSWPVVAFWLAVATGFLLSIPFVWDDGGPRVIAATFPMLAGLVAMALATRGPDAQASGENRAIRAVVMRLTVALVFVALAMPGVLHLFYRTSASSAGTLQADEIAIDGYATVGVDVVDQRHPSGSPTQIDVEQLTYSVGATLGGQDLPSFLDYPRPYSFFLAYDLTLRYPIFVFAPPSSFPPRARVVKLKVKRSHRISYFGYLAE